MPKLNKNDIELVEENNEDFRLSVISRKNLTNEFTIESIEKHLRTLEKLKIEAEGTIGLAKATRENVERNHPHVLDIPLEKIQVIWMWYEQKALETELQPKLDEVLEEIQINQDHLDVIYDKFGFIKSDVSKIENGKENNEDGPTEDRGPDALGEPVKG